MIIIIKIIIAKLSLRIQIIISCITIIIIFLLLLLLLMLYLFKHSLNQMHIQNRCFIKPSKLLEYMVSFQRLFKHNCYTILIGIINYLSIS